MRKSLSGALAILLASTICAQASVQDLINGVKSKNLEAVQKLLAGGEDVNGQNEQGNTALHYAIATDNAEMTRLLLNNGANLNIVNEKGWTPLKIAEKKDVKNVSAVLAEIQSANKGITENNEINTIAAERRLIQRAAAEVERARDSEKTALAAQEEAETKALILESKVAMLEKTLSEKTKALENAEQKVKNAQATAEKAVKAKAEAEKAKIQAENKAKNVKASAEIKAGPGGVAKNTNLPASKVAPKAVTKPQPKKPIVVPKVAQPKPIKVRIPQPSTFHKNMTDGADEVIYCLDLLGQGENKHMSQAGAYYAATNGVKEARYQQIISYAADFYHNADDNALKQRVDTCGKVITPNDAAEQNKIIRALNQALGSQPNSLIAIEQ